MTQCDVNEVYDNLNGLLKDICEFLNEEIKNGKLSTKAKKLAKTLIERTNEQLEVIAQVTPSVIENEENYDTLLPGANTEENKEQFDEVYEVPNLLIPTVTTISPTILDCPYLEMSAEQLSGKKGPLLRTRRIFFIDHTVRCFAGIQENWLLVYNNAKEQKPFRNFNINNIEAKAIAGNCKKYESSFELLMKDEKIQMFTARSPKDMEQWLAAVNYSKKSVVQSRNLPTIPTTNVDKEEVVFAPDDEIYASCEPDASYLAMDCPKPECISKLPLLLKNENVPSTTSLPRLPKRNVPIEIKMKPQNNTPIPDVQDPVEEEDDIYDVIPATNRVTIDSRTSSEDEELPLYVDVPEIAPEQKNNLSDSCEDIYIELGPNQNAHSRNNCESLQGNQNSTKELTNDAVQQQNNSKVHDLIQKLNKRRLFEK